MPLCDLTSKFKSRNLSFANSAVRRRARRLQQRFDILESKFQDAERERLELYERLKAETCRADQTTAELAFRSSIEQPSSVPLIFRERPMSGFQFNLTIIAASIELGKRIGFRAAEDALQIVFDMLGVNLPVPSHDAIEQWVLRLGVASLKDTFKKDERVLWMVDHSSQIGKERLLLIVGVALADLPPPGQTLTLDKMKVLAVVPGQQWKKEDVEREYLKLARQIGAPAYLVSDGATELRDPAQKLEKDGQKTIVLGDLKHHAANVLEKELNRNGRFESFLREVGLTRNRVQQTELDQFAPPTLRIKSRFMNVGALFKWATMVLYHLDKPASKARKEISIERMNQKLGWLKGYVHDLAQWNKCQEVIDLSLSVINLHGLDAQTEHLVERTLDQHNRNWRSEDCSATRIAVKLLDWIRDSFGKLPCNERVWLSTEILESLFGKFKQLERQHSKGGFTRLIAAIPTLCMRATRETVRKAFREVDSKATRKWITDSLGKTLTARRNAAYRESREQTRDQQFSPA